jgi:membrane protease subunit (stomatin/prohibitin family)
MGGVRGEPFVGIFKRMKDMKDMVEAAPGMVQQARQLGAQAQEYAAAQQTAAQLQMNQVNQMTQGRPGATPNTGAGEEPIAGVSIELFAAISKGLAAYGYDQSKAVELAAAKGVSAGAWAEALDGWNARIATDPSVAQRFNALYRAG